MSSSRAYMQRWKEANRAHVQESQRLRNRAKKIRNRDFIRDQKRAPCMDCRMTFDPVCMDFDHRPDEAKEFDVTAMQDHSIERIKREIAKCDLVCANCHRLRTATRARAKQQIKVRAIQQHQLSLIEPEETT